MKHRTLRAAALRLSSLIVLSLCGCPAHPDVLRDEQRAHPPVEAKPSAQADAALQEAERKAASQSKPEAVETYLSVRRSYPETVAGQEALYRAGAVAFEGRDYATARQSFNELLYENPLFPKANDAKLMLGLSALELGAYRDAYQTLSSVAERLEGANRQRALDGAALASQRGGVGRDTLRLALKAVEDAPPGAERDAALAQLSNTVESKVSFEEIAQAVSTLSESHPGWPILEFKLARIYYHLREWNELQTALDRFLRVAPDSPYAPRAREMQARAETRDLVKPRTVGVILPLSGKYKPIGEAVLRGIQLGLSGSEIQLVVKDSQGDVQLAGRAVEELTFDQQAIAAMGPVLSDDSRRAALVAEELQLPLLTLTRQEGITSIGSYIFRNMLTNSGQAAALADYATKKLGFKSFAVLFPNIPYGVELTNSFWDEVVRRGGVIRGAESYDHDQTTFTSEAKKLVGRYYLEDRGDYQGAYRDLANEKLTGYQRRKAMEKVKDVPPVVDFEALLIPDDWRRVGLVAPALAVEDIITNACDPKDLEKIRKTTGRENLRTVTLLGTNQWSSPKGRSGVPELVERGGKFVTCSIYVDGFYADSVRPATRRFVAAYQKANGGADPGLLEAIGYDSARIYRYVVEKLGPRSRAEFRSALANLKNFDGATGSTSFTEQREAQKPLFFLSVDAKGVKELPPPETKVSGS